MRSPITVIFNDTHLKVENERDLIQSVVHMIKHVKKLGLKKIIFAGDLFHSRQAQRLSTLQTFDEILKRLSDAEITLYIFPGNHDKADYSSEDSFLDAYRNHPNVKFNRTLKNIEIEGVSITLLPFFADELLIPMLKEAKGTDVLISHFEMAGSTNLGRTSEKTTINQKLLSKWKKVYLGHYHNTHEISNWIVHLPSLRQNDFGEDENKGFTVLYDDLSYEIIRGDFRAYRKIIVNIDEIKTKDLKELINIHSDSKDSIRFELIGEESKLKAFDKSLFTGSGIDVKVKYEKKWNFDNLELEAPKVIEKYDKGSVLTTFEKFCEDKGYDFKKGVLLLNEFFKSKEQ
jgi:exonuclease SbcD